MNEIEKIKVAIVDDNKEFLESLIDHLNVFPEIEICGYATQYKQARELLLNKQPDLVFLDIEMPCKNGFELLNEVRKRGCTFSVIFYTAYDKYMIQALRESAFDFILKPVDEKELKITIERYKAQIDSKKTSSSAPLYSGSNGSPAIVALPCYLGLRFIDRNRILLVKCTRDTMLNKPYWEAVLTDLTTVKLNANLSAEKLILLLSKGNFFQINQSCIVNFSYLNMVEFKSRNCLLLPPFDKLELKVSRSQLPKLRNEFEVF